MASLSTLEQIEADLKFCEDVLNNRAQPPLTARRTATQPHRLASSHGAGTRPASGSGHATPRSGARPGAGAGAWQIPPLSPLNPAQQQQRTPPLSPLLPAQQQQQAAQVQLKAQAAVQRGHAAPAPAVRTTEELLDMLSSMPEGQPFEIDTRLLYSPHSSLPESGCNSPGGQQRGSRAGSVLDEQHLHLHGGGSGGGGGAADGNGGGGGGGSHRPRQPATARHNRLGSSGGPSLADLGLSASEVSPLRDVFSDAPELAGYGSPAGADLGPDLGAGLGLVDLDLHGSGPWRSQQHAAGPQLSPQQLHLLQQHPHLQHLHEHNHQQQQYHQHQHQQQPPDFDSSHNSRVLNSSVGSRASRFAGVRPGSAAAASGGISSGAASSALDTSAKQQQPARQLLLEDVLENGVKGCTAALLRQGREERIKQLAQPRTDLWQRCAQQRVQEERAELQECTFAPKTGRPPSRHRLTPGLPVEERLQRVAAGKAEALERARSEREKEALQGCTFTPQLVTQPERHLRSEYTPLHRRLGEEQRRRGANMAQARLQQDLGDADLTFQPHLNQRSLKMAAEKEARQLYDSSGGSASGSGGASTPRSQGRPGSAGRGSGGEDGGFTFAPAINQTSERLLEDSETVPRDFRERLRYYSQRKQQKQAAAAEAEADDCTFRPDTGNAVQVLALSASRAGNLLETEQERYQRMAEEEAQRQAARRAAKEAEVYGSLDFKPQLNPRSLEMAPGGSGGVEALASGEKQRRRLERLAQEVEQERLAECTFRPNTSKPRVVGYYDEYQPPLPNAPISIAHAAKQGFEGLTQRIAEYQADKDARAAAVKAEEEARALRECSFAPDINRKRVQAKGPVVVRGLDRHLELRQLAERHKAEAEERAAKVFYQKPQAKQGFTVPKPFRLAGHALLEAKAAEKQAAALESALCDRMRVCTFQPHTNHQRRKEQLQRILEQPSYSDLAGA